MNQDAHTLQILQLPVGDGHELYVHEWGNASLQTPIVYLHGGPGGSVSDRAKKYFNPEHSRVLFFDQRGSGQSTPSGSLKNNTTPELIEDIVQLLDHFKVQKCILFGGSWGSALALLFAIAYPERTAGLIIYGIFTGTSAENEWIEKGAVKTFFPDVWERYLATVPAESQDNPTAYHFERILGGDAHTAQQSGFAYQSLEGSLVFFDDRYNSNVIDTFEIDGVRMEVHYLANKCFIPENYILDNASKLTMPIKIVQGRYDMVCPPVTAHALNKVLPNSELTWTLSGHVSERESWTILRYLAAQMSREQND